MSTRDQKTAERATPPMVLNLDGVTFRFPGNAQWPMTKEQQVAAGFLAAPGKGRSISGKPVKSTDAR